MKSHEETEKGKGNVKRASIFKSSSGPSRPAEQGPESGTSARADQNEKEKEIEREERIWAKEKREGRLGDTIAS